MPSTSAFSALLEQLHRVSWSSTRPDFYDHYRTEYLSRENGTLMPPSPGVERYWIKVVPDPGNNQVKYTMLVVFRPELQDLYEILDNGQILHRSRQVALAAGPLRAFTLDKRNNRLRNNRDALKKIEMPVKQQADLLKLMGDELTFAYNPSHIIEFLNEHEKAGVGRGLKWGMLKETGRSEWLQAKSVAEEVRDHLFSDYSGKYMNRPLWSGLRAKNTTQVPSRDKFLHTDKKAMLMQGSITETRIVNYTAQLSVWGVFLTQKAHKYAKILTELADTWDLPFHVTSPLISGGLIYPFVDGLFRDGYNHYPYDGGSWESVVGATLSKGFSQFFTPIQEWDTLPSGIAITSLIDTVLSLWAVNECFALGGDDTLVVLGDDWNIFSKRAVKDPGLGELGELDAGDQARRFALGLSFLGEKPRVQGLKFTSDRSDKSIGINLSRPYEKEQVGHATQKEVELWHDLHTDGVDVLKLLERYGPEAWETQGPSSLVQALAAG